MPVLQPCVESPCERYSPITVFDRIKGMSVEKMAEFLKDGFDCCLCSEHERLSDNPFCKDEKCDEQCGKHCKEWLESEVSE